MAAGALMLLAAGGAAGAYGQLMAGEAEGRAAEMNAQNAEQNAAIALERAAIDERALRVQGRKFLGDMRTSYGASGVTMEGSPLEVLKESAAMIELDALNVRYEGTSQAMAFRNEATLERYRGEYARETSKWQAAGTLLSTAGSMAAKSKTKSTDDESEGGGSMFYSHPKKKWLPMSGKEK